MNYRIVISLFLLAVLYSIDSFSQEKIKVLSYNVLNGFQSDSINQERYLKWVNKMDPDIVAYQEMNKFTQDRLDTFAARYGHPYAVISKKEGYPVALSSKYPIVNVQKVVGNIGHGYLYAITNNIHVFVVHFSAGDYLIRSEELRQVLAHAATLPQDERILIMGDFNALDRRDSNQYGSSLLKDMQEREKKHNQNNLNNGVLDYSVMDYITSAGYQDTYWLMNDHYQYSLPTKKYNIRSSRRIDYIWANAVAAKDVKKSAIIHDKDTDEMSDHYPMYIEMDLR